MSGEKPVGAPEGAVGDAAPVDLPDFPDIEIYSNVGGKFTLPDLQGVEHTFYIPYDIPTPLWLGFSRSVDALARAERDRALAQWEAGKAHEKLSRSKAAEERLAAAVARMHDAENVHAKLFEDTVEAFTPIVRIRQEVDTLYDPTGKKGFGPQTLAGWMQSVFVRMMMAQLALTGGSPKDLAPEKEPASPD